VHKSGKEDRASVCKKHQNSDNKETRLAALKTINKIGSSKVSPKYATSRNAKYIYFLKSGSNIKIGITNNLRQRFENIGTYTPYPPTLENCITTDRASELENLLHTTLQKYNTHREWFLLPTSIESFVLELNSPEEVINFCENLIQTNYLWEIQKSIHERARYLAKRGQFVHCFKIIPEQMKDSGAPKVTPIASDLTA
jgi:hypothetical protein